MELMYPDYQNGIVNLSCSILKHYAADFKHPTLPVLDAVLKKDYKNVLLMLFDGMGIDALEYHLPEGSFLRRHLVSELSSVYPSTTAAATTSIESGLTPKEHGWIGWSLYFKELDKIVNILPNTEKYTGEQAEDYHVAGTIMPYMNIFDNINKTGNAQAFDISPFHRNKVSSLDEMEKVVKKLFTGEGKKFVYTYWDEPDHTMHEKGCYAKEVTALIKDIDQRVEKLCDEMTDTLVIVTADHGHINLKYKILSDYPLLLNMLERPIVIESRAAGFYIKKEYLDSFAQEFRKELGDDFLLLSKKEVLESKLFGEGVVHLKFADFIGDYVAVATSDYGIVQSQESRQFTSNHAGLTKQEMLVPFIAIEIN